MEIANLVISILSLIAAIAISFVICFLEQHNQKVYKEKEVKEEGNDADEHFYLNEQEKAKFDYLRGSKKIERTAPDGSKYMYSEGAMSPIDELSLPGRTMLTSEGSINRST